MSCQFDDVDGLLPQNRIAEHAPRWRLQRVRWFGGSMRQLAQLLDEVPTNQVAAAAGRWHPAACLGRRESIATYARAAVHACLACCPCDARSALMAVLLADRHHGAERPNRRPPRRMCFVWDVWARMGAKRHASRHIIRHGSLLPMCLRVHLCVLQLIVGCDL